MKDVIINIEDIDFTKPKKYYCKIYGLSQNALRNRFRNLGILDKFTTGRGDNMKILNAELQEEYYKNPKICKHCNKLIEYKKRDNNFCSHKCVRIYYFNNSTPEERKMSEEQKLILSKKSKEYWIKNPKPKIYITKKCEFCDKDFQVYKCHGNRRKFCSKKCSNIGSDNSNRGGYRGHAGNSGKFGWYKGYYCQSSWELAYVIYNLEHNINFERNSKGFEYFFGEKVHKFHPDFYLPELKTYVEIKGRIRPDDIEKINQFKGSLIVLFKEQIIPILKYVIEKYGTNFIELYDGNPHKVKKNKCLSCEKPAKLKYCSRQCSCRAAQKLSPFASEDLTER